MQTKALCPRCGSRTGIPIVYGFFDHPVGDLGIGEYTLGGCCVEDEVWKCNDPKCGEKW